MQGMIFFKLAAELQASSINFLPVAMYIMPVDMLLLVISETGAHRCPAVSLISGGREDRGSVFDLYGN